MFAHVTLRAATPGQAPFTAAESRDAAAFYDYPRLFGYRRSFVKRFEDARGTAKTSAWRVKSKIRLARESAQTDFKQGFSIGVETDKDMEIARFEHGFEILVEDVKALGGQGEGDDL
jgi:hypothetical protein